MGEVVGHDPVVGGSFWDNLTAPSISWGDIEELEAAGAEVPEDDSELHVPRATLHAALARGFGPAEDVEPLYVRVPDAERSLA